ncbi:response regulator transcription factor [Paenibacillus senegalimassiliensis]|uniref:response regulator transcription factor n=1 Tax=Paenibacillus senegalimassiliensis TaxID=1737426 RepID=UPI00073EC474|nr:response regulator [Paenibacillus senegalimassiliensis]
MKILIVDDEARHRRGMFHLLQAIRPEYEVVMAKNGAEALDMVPLLQPDVVLTDIRMPHMDGLTFLEKLSAFALQPKVIFLSAYNLFEYAQTALRYGAYDYLLKPVDTDKVEEVLSRIEQQLMEDKGKTDSKAEGILGSWLKGIVPSESLQGPEIVELLGHSGFAVVTEFCAGDGRSAGKSGARLCHELREIWSCVGAARSWTLEEESDRVLAVTLIAGGMKDPGICSDITQVRQALERMCYAPEYAGGRLSHAAGVRCKRLLEEGPHSFQTAMAALTLNFHDSWKGVVFAWEEPEMTGARLNLDHEQLFAVLCTQEAKAALQLCRTAFEELANGGWTNPDTLKDGAAFTLMMLKSRCGELLDRKTALRLAETSAKELPACETMFALLSALEARLLEVRRELQDKKRGRGEYAAEATIRLIQSRFMEELTLENLAEQFYFNPSYFSTLFKNYTGRTFSEMLTETRINRAKELLSDPECTLKIYDIAERSGYRDTKYFGRIFKRYVGVSPEAYRHKSLGNLGR